jgi:tetratricopeptide (TPR) repeat protein
LCFHRSPYLHHPFNFANRQVFKHGLAQTYLQKAHCLIALGRSEEAIPWFRKVLEQEEASPSAKTQGYLDFPTFIVANERQGLYSEADQILRNHADRLMFPVDHYRWNSALAIISENDGNLVSACEFASRALEAAGQGHSGFRYHPKVGLVQKQDERIQRQLVELTKQNKRMESNS